MRSSIENGDVLLPRLRGTRSSRILIVASCFIVAPAAGFFVSRIVPERFEGIASTSAIWICMYPIALINRRSPWWTHWLRGLVLLLGFVLVEWWLR